MRKDELGHAKAAMQAGVSPLPMPIKKLMQLQAKVMTTVAYWV